MPEAQAAEHDEVMRVVERDRLYGRGIGWVDAHLPASARLSDAPLWTLDKALLKVAAEFGVAC